MTKSEKEDKYLHIIAFDIPYPPNYGGVIDIYFKIRSLHACGVKVILHAFVYGGRTPNKLLDKYCKKVYYYKRRVFKNPFYGDLPYIVATRSADELLENLVKDDHPILFEGLHTTYFLQHEKLKHRFKIVRTHNIEHDYYKALEEVETNFFKKYFFRIEADRLKSYENVLQHAALIAAISPEDQGYYQKQFPQVKYLPAFHSNEKVVSKPGKGKFILYHGNLAIGENHKAALYLVNEVFSGLNLPCVIAGNHPQDQLEKAVDAFEHITLVKNIGTQEILQLVQDAHINVLVTFQDTGIKLKLLNSLYRGRHCVVNDLMVNNNGLEGACHVERDAEGLKKSIQSLWGIDFGEEEIEWRNRALGVQFDNHKNAEFLKELLP